MAKAHTTWKVLPHGPIEKLSANLWRVEANLPGMEMKRVMSIGKRVDGTLVIHNAIALGEPEMAQIEAWGKVSTIVVPNGFHRMDAKVFKDRYPDARVLCPSGAKAKVEQVVPVDGSYADLPADAAVELQQLDGTKDREGVMIVRAGNDTSLVFNDAVFNMPHLKGFTGFVLRRVTSSTGGPRVSRIAKLFVIADKAAFRAHVEKLAALPCLARVVVSHHETITEDPAGTLKRVLEAM
ncbi:MAG: hypothetical protein H0T46_18520 [Deltaproteobacteria bacterium]|nr:hypothetical protein [Deltaproteobacteria bacterium]